MTRQEHIASCKARAVEYLNAGDLPQAATALIANLGTREDTAAIGRALALEGMRLVVAGDAAGLRRWIEGVN